MFLLAKSPLATELASWEELFCTLSLCWMTSGRVYKLITNFIIFIFRKLEGYSAPRCGSDDIFQVLSKYSKLLYADQRSLSASQGRLEIKKFAFELESSVSCLTSTPSQFLALDSLEAEQEALKLKDNLQDIINIVDMLRNNLPRL